MVVTMNPKVPNLAAGDVLVEDGRIAAVGGSGPPPTSSLHWAGRS